ncbi:hypothetical protein BDE02_03G081700 [Populus trichocarpa]|nr:hypothetical protein BDE02_03G081700 [Populus trichocarpa]
MPCSPQAAVKQRHETFENSQGHHKECRNELGVHFDVDHFAEVIMNHIAL